MPNFDRVREHRTTIMRNEAKTTANRQFADEWRKSDLRQSEVARFKSILKRHVEARNEERSDLRNVLVEYIRFSPNASELINVLILSCVSMRCAERLDIGIDVLSQAGQVIANYAYSYLHQDIKQWNKLYPESKYRPDDDFWYILLRSVGRAKCDPNVAICVISACHDEPSRGIAEGVVEALGDLGTIDAKNLLQLIQSTHPDNFIKELATDVLEDFRCVNSDMACIG